MKQTLSELIEGKVAEHGDLVTSKFRHDYGAEKEWLAAALKDVALATMNHYDELFSHYNNADFYKVIDFRRVISSQRKELTDKK